MRPRAQGQGYGRALLDFADQRAAAPGVAVIRLYTNVRMEKNTALIGNMGMSSPAPAPIPSRVGEMLVDMERTVPPSVP